MRAVPTPLPVDGGSPPRPSAQTSQHPAPLRIRPYWRGACKGGEYVLSIDLSLKVFIPAPLICPTTHMYTLLVFPIVFLSGSGHIHRGPELSLFSQVQIGERGVDASLPPPGKRQNLPRRAEWSPPSPGYGDSNIIDLAREKERAPKQRHAPSLGCSDSNIIAPVVTSRSAITKGTRDGVAQERLVASNE